MSDSDDKKPLGIRGGSGKASNVRQSFGHGRTKSVVVETKRKRVVIPTAIPQKVTENSSSAPQPPGLSKRPSGITDAEMTRRLTALKAAKEQEGELYGVSVDLSSWSELLPQTNSKTRSDAKDDEKQEVIQAVVIYGQGRLQGPALSLVLPLFLRVSGPNPARGGNLPARIAYCRYSVKLRFLWGLRGRLSPKG